MLRFSLALVATLVTASACSAQVTPTTPAPFQGRAHGWCFSADHDDLHIHTRTSPRGPRLLLVRESSGMFSIATRRSAGMIWPTGEFASADVGSPDGKVRCSSRRLQEGTRQFGPWTLTVGASEIRIDHAQSPITIVLERRVARLRLDGRTQGEVVVEADTEIAESTP